MQIFFLINLKNPGSLLKMMNKEYQLSEKSEIMSTNWVRQTDKTAFAGVGDGVIMTRKDFYAI